MLLYLHQNACQNQDIKIANRLFGEDSNKTKCGSNQEETELW
jgi:hypothetical protein